LSWSVESLHAGTIHVDKAATGANNGSSWGDAYLELRDAVDNAGDDDDIWIATGVYTPGTTATDSFVLDYGVTGVKVYGGFPTGGGDGTFGARNPDIFVTTLSGDLGAGNRSNVIVTASSVNAGVFDVLDGLTISGGSLAVSISTGTPRLNNLRIVYNQSTGG
jgi:hypothetical protein